jgi:hypothetical protein
MSVAFDFGAEITHPIDASFSTGLLMNASQIIGISFITMTSQILDKDPDSAAICFLALSGASGLGLIASLFVKSDLRRFNAERI